MEQESKYTNVIITYDHRQCTGESGPHVGIDNDRKKIVFLNRV